MKIQKGDLIWVTLPQPRGSEPSGRRPALVLQSDAFNRSRINTIIVAAITSNLRLELMPGTVRLDRGEAGIPKASIINLSQIHSIDRSFISRKLGSLSRERMEAVLQCLKLVLDIPENP